MIIAIASGKGGTGKTTVSSALARVWNRPLTAVDLDVEAPNLHLFLKPEMAGSETATLEVPEAHPELCTGCNACRDLCAFKAVAVFGTFPTVFADMCHGCGGCLDVCPTGALTPGTRELGIIQWGTVSDGLDFIMGRLRIGEAMSPPLMREVRRRLRDRLAARPSDVLIDAPPGTACPAIESVRDADCVVLITEPTPFGLYDLELAYQAFADLGKPMGVVINRSGLGNSKIEDFCEARELPVLGAIPFERAIAENYAKGVPLDAVSPAMKVRVRELAGRVRAFAEGAQCAETARA